MLMPTPKSPNTKRMFFLMVNPKLLPFTMSKTAIGNRKNIPIGSYYVPVGRRFGTGKYGQKTPEKIQMAQMAQQAALEEVVRDMEYQIKLIMKKYCMQLIEFWFSNVDHYFNRSSHGRYYPSKIRGYKRTKHIPRTEKNRLRKPHRMSSKTYQLRHALKVESMNAFVARLFVYPCHSRTKGHGNTDYVTILILGAPEKFGNHYVPSLNKRLRGGSWGGISARYWSIWYTRFNAEVQEAEDRMNMEIAMYMKKFMKTKENQILFDPTLMNSKAKNQEFKEYNKVRRNRAAVNAKYSDIPEDTSEYSTLFNAPINTSNIPTFDSLISKNSPANQLKRKMR